MKDFSNSIFTQLAMAMMLLVYLILPPALTTYYFLQLNLNPFAIIKFWHYNPFSAARGIPAYQPFLYLLALWLALNVVIFGCMLLISRLISFFNPR
ncbi:hypothetical protein [Serratia odorifera]|jgi:hypothetical protein|uniref:Uncharacterized protein n=2 Tax=Serratia odorifera TaxID=618 RepID=D4E5N4_SEROD|nr:hypothetical protein [Serratia odorifera]EFE95050.1 hypothetical protein HMPREF0758_3484 [Serratia odorifera DSM 4582]MBJ2067544.1 hypothetical protein [Serratia odorifera]PNK89664.1 hypothetical protein CEQ31_008070 [Serratia odorifera]RII70752.1 hypothetical protein DX901_18250 [Serratia odorifera]VDZ62556.1 Uncharacterised protein [Serratia odorifera]